MVLKMTMMNDDGGSVDIDDDGGNGDGDDSVDGDDGGQVSVSWDLLMSSQQCCGVNNFSDFRSQPSSSLAS